MATPIKRIEKDFMLKALYDEQIPLIYIRNRVEYFLFVEKPAREEISLKCSQPIEGLRIKQKIELLFDYRGQVISFAIEPESLRDDRITARAPEFLYKNLDRSFARVSTPKELDVQFSFLGDRYSLSYPKIMEYEAGDLGEFVHSLDPRDLSGLIDQMAQWIKGFASGYKLVIFRDVKPSTPEERIVSETGKSFFLPSTLGHLPRTDPFPKKRLITEDIFKRYLESTGVERSLVDDACDRFIKTKFDGGIFSDLWVPILFQEYVIGYIHAWISRAESLPFDYEVIETLYQFAKVLAFSLKVNGYFEQGKIRNESFEGKVIDISASGLLFAYPHSSLAHSLLPDSELQVRLIAPRRTINVRAKIVRRFKDSSNNYFGCRFLNLEPEDLRFLFELIYGKPFTDSDMVFLAGQV